MKNINTGNQSTGYWSAGSWLTGYWPTVNQSTGYGSTGYGSTGNGSTGYWPTGNQSTGYGSTGYGSTGHFSEERDSNFYKNQSEASPVLSKESLEYGKDVMVEQNIIIMNEASGLQKRIDFLTSRLKSMESNDRSYPRVWNERVELKHQLHTQEDQLRVKE